MKTIKTNEQLVMELKAAGIPATVAENVALVYPVEDMRRIANEADAAKLTQIVGIGAKRAAVIISALKGRIPELYRTDIACRKPR